MGIEITITPSERERPFVPKKVHISGDAIRLAVAALVFADLPLTPGQVLKNVTPETSKELMNLAKALRESDIE